MNILKSHRIFSFLVPSIEKFKAFIKTDVKNMSPKSQLIYDEALQRYETIVGDADFIEKLKELILLETILLQEKAIHNISPVLHLQPTGSSGEQLVFTKSSYVDLVSPYNYITKSMGYFHLHGKNIKKVSEDPAFMEDCKKVLVREMRKRSCYPEYKAKYSHE